jgi:hypothetical protein
MARHAALDRRIGVRVPASQPSRSLLPRLPLDAAPASRVGTPRMLRKALYALALLVLLVLLLVFLPDGTAGAATLL